MPRPRRPNAAAAASPAAPRGRANNRPPMPFAHKLVLNQWPLEYDQNIVKHTQRLNERRSAASAAAPPNLRRWRGQG